MSDKITWRPGSTVWLARPSFDAKVSIEPTRKPKNICESIAVGVFCAGFAAVFVVTVIVLAAYFAVYAGYKLAAFQFKKIGGHS